MNKAVLIVDIPDSCFNCNFHNYHYCYATTGSNEDGDCVEKYLKDEVPGETKPDWCPVKKLPERRRYGEEFFNGDVKDWNDCLKEILGDESNLSTGE